MNPKALYLPILTAPDKPILTELAAVKVMYGLFLVCDPITSFSRHPLDR